MAGQTSPFDPRSLERQRKRTHETRNAEASRLFASEAVNAALSDAAGKGLTAAYLAPSSPMDLRDTVAAKTIYDQLKAAGFSLEWKLVQPTPDAEKSFTLRVSWGDDATPRG